MTFIDGHNLYHALDLVDENRFEEGLQQLILDLKVLLRRGRSILVLDGTGGIHPHGHEQQLTEHLRRVYSGTISADDWIENWVSRHKPPQLKLVSADRRLFGRIRRKGYECLDPVRWYRRIQKKQMTQRKPRADVSAPDKPREVGSVDDWLQYFGEKT